MTLIFFNIYTENPHPPTFFSFFLKQESVEPILSMASVEKAVLGKLRTDQDESHTEEKPWQQA